MAIVMVELFLLINQIGHSRRLPGQGTMCLVVDAVRLRLHHGLQWHLFSTYAHSVGKIHNARKTNICHNGDGTGAASPLVSSVETARSRASIYPNIIAGNIL